MSANRARVGIDIEQFMRDPYGTGIQRVLQYLAIAWPADVPADFLVPAADGRPRVIVANLNDGAIRFEAEPGLRVERAATPPARSGPA